MSDLRPQQDNETAVQALRRKHRCLQYLSFWLNSVAVNTKHTVGTESVSAPILLVGTHKDIVDSAQDHQAVSKLLQETFYASSSWPFVVENDTDQLIFFPVANVVGCADPTIKVLMHVVTAKLKDSFFLTVMRPLSWFKVVELLSAIGIAAISYHDVAKIAARYGIQSETVPELLKFLHDMGVVMWFHEEGLDSTVILDPVAYFVNPITRVICDPKKHCPKIHDECRKKHGVLYDELITNRLANKDVLTYLLGGQEGHAEIIILLMLKLGLLVRWDTEERPSSAMSTAECFLVPSLFLESAESLMTTQLHFPLPGDMKVPVSTVYLLFSPNPKSLECGMYEEHIRKFCFLPTGLFEQLTAKAVSWSQLTPGVSPQGLTLEKNLAILVIGNVWFRMVHRPDHNCIQVDVVGQAVLAVLDKLLAMLTKINDSSSQRLHVRPYVSLTDSSSNQRIYIGVNQLNEILTKEESVIILPSGDVVDSDAVHTKFQWLTQRSTMAEPSHYDIFLSYRWNKNFEDSFVVALYEQLADFVFEERAVAIFLDRHRIGLAEHFRTVFFKALMNSMLMVPVVSPVALQLMLSDNMNINEIDNLLVEWLSALVFIRFKAELGSVVVLKTIYPVWVKDASGNSYFTYKAQLSTKKPLATIREVKDMIACQFGTRPTVVKWIEQQTVKSIVDRIMTYNNPQQVSTTDMKMSLATSRRGILEVLFPKSIYTGISRICGKCPFVPSKMPILPRSEDCEPMSIRSSCTGMHQTKLVSASKIAVHSLPSTHGNQNCTLSHQQERITPDQNGLLAIKEGKVARSNNKRQLSQELDLEIRKGPKR
jgi:hypothetical protein